MTTAGARPPLLLLNPEWQGYGGSDPVGAGARLAAAELFGAREVVALEVAEIEPLRVEDGVLGLDAIVRQAAAVRDVLHDRQPDRIVMVGGTCAADLAPVAYLNARYAGDLAVVWFDAHGDVNTPASSPSGRFHGMVLRTLLGEGAAPLVALVERPLRVSQVFLAGTRDLDPPEAAMIAARHVSVTTTTDLVEPEVLAGRIRAAGWSRVYLHVDMDVFDPGAFPDALMRVPGGTTPAVVARAVAAVAAVTDVVGLSLVEYCVRSPEGGALALRPLVEAAGFEPANSGD